MSKRKYAYVQNILPKVQQHERIQLKSGVTPLI